MKKFFEKFGCGMEKTIQQVIEDKERLENCKSRLSSLKRNCPNFEPKEEKK